jgi:hypothetical protein
MVRDLLQHNAGLGAVCQECDHPIDGVDVDRFRAETGSEDGVPARCHECQEKHDHEHREVAAPDPVADSWTEPTVVLPTEER